MGGDGDGNYIEDDNGDDIGAGDGDGVGDGDGDTRVVEHAFPIRFPLGWEDAPTHPLRPVGSPSVRRPFDRTMLPFEVQYSVVPYGGGSNDDRQEAGHQVCKSDHRGGCAGCRMVDVAGWEWRPSQR